MRYIKQNKVYEIHEIRQEFKETSISEGCDLSHLGYDTLIEPVPPTQDGFIAVEDGAINNELQWKLVAIPITVPQSVTPRQARLALLQATLLDDVELLLANDKAMQIWWEYSLEIERNHTHIITMGTALNLTSLQLDDLFILAATL